MKGMETNLLNIMMKKSLLIHLKQQENFEEHAKRKMEEIWDLSKQIDFNNLIYHHKSKNFQKMSLCFKGLLKFYKSR